MRRTLKLSKGFDLPIEGGLPDSSGGSDRCLINKEIAIVPDDFTGFTPRLLVKEGDVVEAGAPLMADKLTPIMQIVTPASGRVKAVVRGERRHIERVIVEIDDVEPVALPGRSADLREALMTSGLWVMMRQRPFCCVPDPSEMPRNIFVSALDTAPLALDPLAALSPERHRFLAPAVKALSALTSGHIYITVRRGAKIAVEGAEIVEIEGPHPAGNPGVAISHIAPVSKGDVVWTLDLLTLARIGEMVSEGKVTWATPVAVTGPEVTIPAVVTTLPGAPVEALLANRLKPTKRKLRIVSGSAMTGISVGVDGWLRWPYRQVTVMLDGSDADEFMGWAALAPKKPTVSRAFLSWLMPRRWVENPDARLNGGRRAMIMSGIYDRYIPYVDIMPEPLIKAILSRNIPEMEALGIYEIAPEDFAVAEFADPSKLDLQRIVADGLAWLRKEV